MKIEIDSAVNLTTEEQFKVFMHSFYNIIQVVFAELSLVQDITGNTSELEYCEKICRDLLNAFSSQEKTAKEFHQIEHFCDEFRANLLVLFAGINAYNDSDKKYLREAHESLNEILEIINLRAKEFLASIELEDKWSDSDSELLQKKLRQVFSAIAANSHGRYGIVFASEEKKENDYLIEFNFTPSSGVLSMPPLFPDIIRDLTANARKYTPIGGKIIVDLISSSTELRLSVRDNGRGIPADEIERVVELGYRASNTHKSESKGDGFGLTKAYTICKRNNGRMWIESELSVGTEITIHIPVK